MASGRTPSYVLEVAADCSGVSCLISGTCLSSMATCSTPSALVGTCSDAIYSAFVSTVVDSFWSALGTACSMVALAADDDDLPLVASSSGISVGALS
jgi:hypothetical protein